MTVDSICAYKGTDFAYNIYIGHGKSDVQAFVQAVAGGKSSVVLFIDSYIKDSPACTSIIEEFSSAVNKDNGCVLLIRYLDAGKQAKSLSTLGEVAEWLVDNGVQRDSLFVGMGGGVIGDLVGLISALYYRGVDLVHIPTNLLSMTDSAVGGKTAVNTSRHVNSLGTYKHPIGTLVYLPFLETLPKRDLCAGLAEVIKIGLLRDDGLLELLENADSLEALLKDDQGALVIKKAIEYKLVFTDADIEERNRRLFLNIGHTFGHAIEAIQDLRNEEYYRHGEAVALGLICSSYLSDTLHGLNTLTRVTTLLKKYNLPVSLDAVFLRHFSSRQDLVEYLVNLSLKDKKGQRGKLRVVLLQDFYSPVMWETCDKKLLAEAFKCIIH